MDVEKGGKARLHFVVEGNPKELPVLVAVPDVGLSSEMAFRPLLSYEANRSLFSRFCVFHTVFPGQGAGDADLPVGSFPSFDEILDQLYNSLEEHGVKSFVGIGVGAGGTILLNYGLKFRGTMSALIMISSDPLGPGWTEYLIGKADRIALQKTGMNEIILKQFLIRWFSSHTQSNAPDLMAQYKVQLSQLNANNLAQFIDSFSARKIIKSFAEATFHLFVFVGLESHNANTTFESFHLFDPNLRNKLEVANCADLVCVEDPAVFHKPLELFFQGLGDIFAPRV